MENIDEKQKTVCSYSLFRKSQQENKFTVSINHFNAREYFDE